MLLSPDVSAGGRAADSCGSWLFDTASDNVDTHCANLGRWRLDYDQISCGAFRGTFTEVRLPGLQVFRETTSQKVRQYGLLGSDSFGIALPWNTQTDINFNGACMSPGNVITCFDAEVDMCTPPEFELRGVVMDAALMEKTLRCFADRTARRPLASVEGIEHRPGCDRPRPPVAGHAQQIVAQTSRKFWTITAARQHLEDNLLPRSSICYRPCSPATISAAATRASVWSIAPAP